MIGQDVQMADPLQEQSPGAAAPDTAMECEYCQSPLTRGQEVLLVLMAQVWREEVHLMEPIGAFCSVDCLRQMQFEPAREDPAVVADNTSA